MDYQQALVSISSFVDARQNTMYMYDRYNSSFIRLSVNLLMLVKNQNIGNIGVLHRQ